jgi:hypothetical protein
MSTAICGINANEKSRMSLRSSGLRLLKLWLALLLPEVGSYRVRAPLRKRLDAVAVQP